MKRKVEDAFTSILALILATIITIISIAVYVGIPIAALYIVYRIAKYLFTGVW